MYETMIDKWAAEATVNTAQARMARHVVKEFGLNPELTEPLSRYFSAEAERCAKVVETHQILSATNPDFYGPEQTAKAIRGGMMWFPDEQQLGDV